MTVIKNRTVPCNPRSKNYAKGTVVNVSGGGTSSVIVAGSDVDIVKSTDAKELTNKNVLSSLRSLDEADKKVLARIIGVESEEELTDDKALSALRVLDEIAENNEALKSIFLRKDQPDTADKLIIFIEGLISKGLITAENGIKLPSGAALYSLYENGLLAFSMDENGFVIYEKGTANKWSVITSAGAEFQNLVIKFLAQITDLEVSNKATTLDLVVQALAKTYNLTVDNTADIMHGIIREYLTSESFVSGFLGSGFKIWKDANGDWCGEFDKLTVRKIFTVFELVVQKVVHQGGMVIRSAAGGKLVKVTDGGTYWKCEHDSTDDFLPDDQVLCQTFTGTSIKRYWRKVTSAGAGYFNLSKTDCEAGSANPEVGDNVAVLGNRTNTDRQSAQIDCAVGVDAPYRDDYAGINSYSLAGKLINRTGNLSGITDPDFGVLSGSGLIGMNAYLKGVFRLKSSGKLVEDAISDAQSESNAYTDGKITTVETNFEIREGQISSKVTQATTAATQASGYATSAQGSASTASAKAGEASTSATNAANSANQASNILTTVTSKETSINQTAEAIELKAVRAESAAGRAESAEASINLKADGIVLQASSQAAQSAVNGVQIGGRNLLLNSEIIITPLYTIDYDNATYYGDRTCYLEAGVQYTVSGICPSGLNWSNVHNNMGSTNALLWLNGLDNGSHQIISSPSTGTTGTTFTLDKTQMYMLRTNVYKAGQYTFSKIQIEKGNKATDWTPAPEDVDASIALRPTTEEIKSQFTMDSSGISMMGKKIALTGLITFSSLASDAQTKITSAQSTAESALANAGTANQSIGTLQSSLGQMAYQNMVSLAKLDSTIVEGGYLKTSLIDANAIVTGSLLAAKIAATDITTSRLTVGAGARIGNLYIYDGGLNTNQQGIVAMGENYMGLSRSSFSLFYNNYSTQGAGWSQYSGIGAIPGRLSVKCVTTNRNFTDPGLQIEVSGNTDNTAINLIAGYVAGFALKTRVVYSTTTLTHDDCYVSCYNTSDIKVYLPSSPQLGKQVFIRRGNYDVTVDGNGKTLHWGNGTGTTRTRINVGDAYLCHFDGIYWCINYVPR